MKKDKFSIVISQNDITFYRLGENQSERAIHSYPIYFVDADDQTQIVVPVQSIFLIESLQEDGLKLAHVSCEPIKGDA